MAKRKVDARYLEWANELPEEMREKVLDTFLNSKAADTVHNLHAAYTQETQRRAEAEQLLTQYTPIVKWYGDHQDVLRSEQFPAIAQEVRSRRGGQQPAVQNGISTHQMNTQLSQELADTEQRYMDLSARLNAGELEWEKTQPILQDLVKYAGSLRQQQQQVFTALQQELEQVRQTQERQARDFPQLIANSAQERMAQQQNAEQLQKEGVAFQLDVTEYLAKHKDRDVSRAIQEFRTGRYANFNQAAEAVFGEDDYESAIAARVEAALAKRQAEQPPSPESNGEGAMSSFPVPIRRLGREERSSAQAPEQSNGVRSFRKPFDRSAVEAKVDDEIRSIITRGIETAQTQAP